MAEAATCSPVVTRQEIINCSVSVWYPEFRDVTFTSVFIPLPADFVQYLKSDGVILPKGCSISTFQPDPLATGQPPPCGSDSEDCQEDQVRWSDTDTSDEEDERPDFPALVEKMETAIATLGCRVVPKLNWSTPRDASWLLPGNTLQCRTAGEVILLLKSSDFIAHDLIHVFDDCKDDNSHEATPIEYTLCLREWAELHPSAEFRCFVNNNSLIAVSQRECSSCYSHLVSHQEDIGRDLVQFFLSHVRHKFPDPSYVFDVWRPSEGDVRLVDFNPFCPRTDSLLFSWDELASGCVTGEGDAPGNNPVIRVVQDEASIQPHDLQECPYPQDAVDLARGEDIHKLMDILRLRGEREAESDDSS